MLETLASDELTAALIKRMTKRDKLQQQLEREQGEAWCEYRTLTQIAEYYQAKADAAMNRHEQLGEQLEDIYRDKRSEFLREIVFA